MSILPSTNTIIQTTKNLISGEVNKLLAPLENEIESVVKEISLDFTSLFPSGIPDDFDLAGFFTNATPQFSLPSLETFASVISTASTTVDNVFYHPPISTIPNPANPQLKTLTYPNDRHITPIGMEPLKPFTGEYPFVSTTKTEAGHILEVDNTPGSERLLNQHVTGTYHEMHADGSQVHKTIGDSYTITAQDGHISIEGKAIIHVRGDITIVTGGNIGLVADGGISVSSASDIRMKARSIALETTGGDFSVLSSGNILQTASGNLESNATNIDTLSSGTTTHTSTGDLNLSSTGKLNLGSGDNISLNAIGAINGDGTAANWLTGNSVKATAATPSKSLGSGVLYSLNADSILYESDDDQPTALAAIQHGLKTGMIDPKEFNQPATNYASDTSTGNKVPATVKVAPSISQLQNLSDPTQIDNFQLSPNFTIGKLSKFTPAGSHRLVAQKGLSIPQLGGNLQLIAQNILEPMLLRYPDMRVTSGFRTATSGKSQHELGMACDLQFAHANQDPQQYYLIAQYIRDYLPFDQLLLEFKNFSTKLPWIHASFNGAGLRHQTLTLFNGTTRGQGLIQMSQPA